MEADIASWYRALLGVLSFVVAGWLFLMSARYFMRLSSGQKLWATGAVLVLIYVADALRESVKDGLGFRLRLIPLTLGLIAYFVYLLEPRRKKTKRFPGDPFGDHRGT
jgi:hypothetical protein